MKKREYSLNKQSQMSVEPSTKDTTKEEKSVSSSKATLQVAEDEPEEDVRCDWIFCAPSYMQPLARPACLLFWVCLTAFTQGLVVNGFVNAVLTTLERRYDLPSVESGLIASMYDIGSLVALVPVTYFGGQYRRSRLISVGALILSLGSFVFTIPQFATGMYQYKTPILPLCYTSGKAYPDFCDKENLNRYKWVFWLGQFLHGVGASPLYTLVISYLDDNLTVAESGLFLGIYYTMSLVGPATGFLLGGAFLDLYVDLGYQPTDLTPENTQIWVGAWWLGFLISGILAFIAVVPIFGFPKYFKGFAQIQANKRLESYGKTSEKSESLDMTIKDIGPSLKLLLRNPTFLCVSLGGSSAVILNAALSTFGPKYMQNMFHMKASLATITIGAVTIPCAAAGLLCGGLVIRLKDMTIKQMLILIAAVTGGGLVLLTGFLVKCDIQKFVGVNTDYVKTPNGHFNINATCNKNCNCQQNRYMYSPICGADNYMYYSACYAGCQSNTTVNNIKYYANCSCITATTTVGGQAYSAHDGQCDSTCTSQYGFLALIGLFQFAIFFTNVPAVQATMRTVPFKLKSFSLGVQWIFMRVLGSIPGPLLAGYLIDNTCTLWSGSCALKGSCSFYDIEYFWRTMFIYSIVFCVVQFIFMLLALILYRPPKCNDATEADSKDEKKSDEMKLEPEEKPKLSEGIDNPTYHET